MSDVSQLDQLFHSIVHSTESTSTLDTQLCTPYRKCKATSSSVFRRVVVKEMRATLVECNQYSVRNTSALRRVEFAGSSPANVSALTLVQGPTPTELRTGYRLPSGTPPVPPGLLDVFALVIRNIKTLHPS
jgi:hypothetical protein